MGAIAFVILLIVGFLLSIIGSIIGIVDAFRVSTLWGLLAFFVPFALLVYCIKFWNRKWARNSLVMALAGLASMLLAFPFLGGFISQRLGRLEADTTVESVDEEDSATGEEQPAAEDGDAAATPEQATEDDELFKESFLPGLPSAAQIALAELLPSTDPNERLKEIERTRPDPYAIVQVPPPPRPAPPAPTNRPTTGTPGGTNAGGNQGSPNGNNAGNRGRTNAGGNNGNGGQAAPPDSGTIRPLPTLPNPVATASQVQVTGIAQVNGSKYAIVRAPGESTSRYVKVGDRLSNGTVLVKRIETPAGQDPVLVLEERGVEVALPVGSGAPVEEEPTAFQNPNSPNVASLPVLP